MKLELGGGKRPRGEGFVNLDIISEADIQHDMEAVPWPIDDATVEELYSSHCLEHVPNLKAVVAEICRVCRLGAKVEIRVPHPFSDMAMCHEHVHTIGETQVDHWCRDFPEMWFPGPRRLEHLGTGFHPSQFFARARELHGPRWTDEDVYRFVPGACQELRFRFRVANV